MFELFLALIDKVILLAQTKDQQQKNIYINIYKPLMVELEKVHLDYISTFQLCLSFVGEDDFLRKVVDTIEIKRIPLRHVRLKLWEYANTIQDNEEELSKREISFSEALLEYFGMDTPGGSILSRTYIIMSLLKRESEEFPIETRDEAEAWLDLEESEPTLASYVKTKYITDVKSIETTKATETAISVLKDQINSLNSRWAHVCYFFSRLEFEITRL